MLCPKDKVACNTKHLENVEIDVCPQCQGVWLEQSEVSNLTRHLSVPEYSSVDELLKDWDVAENIGTLPKDFWSESKLICPKDGTQMQKHYFAGGHIGVDQCHVCKGFWLDGGELHAIADFVAPNPTVDNAWKAFIKDEKEWRKKMEDMELLPVTIGYILTNPVYGLTVIGSFITHIIIDKILFAKEEVPIKGV